MHLWHDVSWSELTVPECTADAAQLERAIRSLLDAATAACDAADALERAGADTSDQRAAAGEIARAIALLHAAHGELLFS